MTADCSVYSDLILINQANRSTQNPEINLWNEGVRNHKQCSFQEKKLALETFFSDVYVGSAMSLRALSDVCGIGYDTLCRWAGAIGWDAGRIDELQRRRCRPREAVTRLPATVQELILELKDRHSSWRPLKLRQYLFRHEQMLIPHGSPPDS